jgi:putative membrane protein
MVSALTMVTQQLQAQPSGWNGHCRLISQVRSSWSHYPEHSMNRYMKLALVAGALTTAACDNNADDNMTDTSAGRLDSATAMGNSAAAMGANSEGMMRDADIFAAMTASNASEVTLGQLGVDSATHADVKQFAQMMVTDHKAMNESVHQIAQQLNLTSQSGDRTEDAVDDSKDWVDDLKGKRGKDFDQKFMDIMVDSHENTLKMLEKAANSTTTAQLTQAINTARPKVQAHLDQAKQIQERVKQ